jgi:CO dehydrogenase/acetyl-CoA synthase gamma subunit (corrinoid Fe-S protein)
MQTLFYSDARSVLEQIQRLTKKKDQLILIRSFRNFRNVKVLFSSTNSDGVDQMIWLTNDMIPFQLGNEIENLLDDAVDEYEKDIQTLSLHLKNL